MEIIFLLDTSNSMKGERINQLNYAMLDVLSVLDYVTKNSKETVNVRVISFNNVAKFVVGNADSGVPSSLAYETWSNLTEKGATDTAHAIRLCKKSIVNDYSNSNFSKTVVMLVTDGQSSDKYDFHDAILEMKDVIVSMKQKKVYFTSVGVCDYDEAELKEFASLNGISGGEKDKFYKDTVYMIDDATQLNSIIEKALKI